MDGVDSTGEFPRLVLAGTAADGDLSRAEGHHRVRDTHQERERRAEVHSRTVGARSVRRGGDGSGRGDERRPEASGEVVRPPQEERWVWPHQAAEVF